MRGAKRRPQYWLDSEASKAIDRHPTDVALATGEQCFVSTLGHNVLFPLRNGIAASVLEDRGSPERIFATIARWRDSTLQRRALYRRILGRADDCFKSKGVLIVPREIEGALLSLGTFQETCVFAIPDTEVGNRIGAAVVLRNGGSTPPKVKSIAEALSDRIAPFQFPNECLYPEGDAEKRQR